MAINKKRSKNKNWEIGSIVNVGFVRDLEVLSVRDEYDFMPDIYTLRSLKTGQYYEFIPHNGLSKIDAPANKESSQ